MANGLAGNDAYLRAAANGSSIDDALGLLGDTSATAGTNTGFNFNNIVGQSFDNFGLGDWAGLAGGLADMYFKWDALNSQKKSARDSHNANATQYNNYLARGKDVQNSIYGNKSTADNRRNVNMSSIG